MAKETKGEDSRDQWGGQMDFILACLGYAVGLGNVWRFPYLCGRSGGAAFLIPYFTVMAFAGLPTFLLELSIGQYCSLTPYMIYRRMCPIFTGIGYTMVVISILTAIYYNMIIAWALYYLFQSFSKTLPWSHCNNSWNTKCCYDDKAAGSCRNVTHDGKNLSACFNATAVCNGSRTSPAEEYLNLHVLKLSDGLSTVGAPNWWLVLALFVAWVLVFACLSHGVKSSGKVVYFTATFPYVLLVALLVRGVTLDGAMTGIKFYIIPKLEHLKKATVWGDAAVQIFFSLSLGGGGLTTLASYNRFHNNLIRDTFIVVIGNCMTSIFAGFVIFSILGFVSKQIGKPIEELSASGPSLAFIAYPDAIHRLPGFPPLWAVLFFFMLILLGIDSQIVIAEVVITCIIDKWPSLRVLKKKVLVVLGVCFASFLAGIVLTCPGGPYILNLMDTFAGGWPLVLSCCVEICMVSYFYGIKTFIEDVKLMLGYPPSIFWIACWLFISPCLVIAVLIFNWISYEPTTYGSYVYPAWGDLIGWGLAGFCVVWIPLVALLIYIYVLCTPNKKMGWLLYPSYNWGPSDPLEKRNARDYGRNNLSRNIFVVNSEYGNPGFIRPSN